ncbi:MAG: hypothetical protein L6Q83_10520 [Gammaproteobacteria bacterium]|nr:hypothetical protein [Gammaproteobacteria bacterium]
MRMTSGAAGIRCLPLLLALAMAGIPSLGTAGEAGVYRFSLTPLAGYRMGGDIEAEEGDEEVELDDDAVVGLILNWPAASVAGDAYTEWEIYVSRQSAGIDRAPAGVDPALEVDITYALLGGTYVGEGELMRPFLAAGIGGAHLSPDGQGNDSDTVFAFGLGGGGQFFPDRRVGLRLEARVLGAVLDSDSALFCGSVSGGATCAFRASGEVLWQWEVFAGVSARF